MSQRKKATLNTHIPEGHMIVIVGQAGQALIIHIKCGPAGRLLFFQPAAVTIELDIAIFFRRR